MVVSEEMSTSPVFQMRILRIPQGLNLWLANVLISSLFPQCHAAPSNSITTNVTIFAPLEPKPSLEDDKGNPLSKGVVKKSAPLWVLSLARSLARSLAVFSKACCKGSCSDVPLRHG
jgi:hypothetical protein